MDTLSENDAKLFHKLMDSLLFFANNRLDIIKNCNSMSEFHNKDIEKTVPIRKKIFSDSALIDEYTRNNPDNLSSDDLKIVSSWRKSLEGEFFIVKYEKDYALFLHSKEQKIYGVKGIFDSFNEKFGGYAPVVVRIRLIQFNDAIIYDGIFFPYNISFGGGMRSSMKVEAAAAVQKYGIITSLETPAVEKKNSDEDMLRFYMKTQDNRDRYYDDIEKLRRKSPALEAIYYQGEAGIESRNIKKSLKSNGVKGHFAVLINTVVASGSTEKELEENIRKVVPQDKQSWLHKFKL